MSDWLTYNPTSGGSGTTQMSVTAANNPSNSPRSQRVIVRDTSGRTASLMVSQAASGASVFISPTTFLVGGAGGLDNIKYININTDLPWNVVSAPDWMSFNELSGFTSTTISFICQANYWDERSGNIYIRNQGGATAVASVTQLSLDYINLSPSSFYFPMSGGSDTINVTSNTDWTLSASSWITLSQTSGNGNSSVSFSVAQNHTGQDLNGVILGLASNFSASTTVEQEGDLTPSGSVTTSDFYAADTGGTYSNGVTSNVPWTAITISSWLSFTPTSGTGGYTNISITAEPNNTGLVRTGSINIRAIEDLSLLATIVVRQQPIEGGGGGGAPEDEYLTFSFSTAGTGTSEFYGYYTYAPSSTNQVLQVSINNGSWRSKFYTASGQGGTIQIGTVSPGDVVKVRGGLRGEHMYASGMNFRLTNIIPFSVSGNIMSLFYGANFQGENTLPFSACCREMFAGLEGLTSAENLVLPATALTDFCYARMFNGCINMTKGPSSLPSHTTKNSCYTNMFYNCTNLLTAPDLPSRIVVTSAYENMFVNCRRLTSAPAISATTVEFSGMRLMFNGCSNLSSVSPFPLSGAVGGLGCFGMFMGCTSLTSFPDCLASTELGQSCYSYMFEDCINLTTAPSLPATSFKTGTSPHELLATYCYQGMFQGCRSLTTAPDLPATTLASYCYANMFYGCTSLTTPPRIYATTFRVTLNGYASYCEMCFRNMFNDCTNLRRGPDLLMSVLGTRSFEGMFYGCSQLNYVKCLATDRTADNCTTNWLYGVASSGTLEKASGTYWTYGSPSALPQGWTQVDA